MRFTTLLFSLFMLVHPGAYANAPQEESEAQKAVRYTAALEANPLASDAHEMRVWLMDWLHHRA
jgi:hypothetical protein